MSNNEDILIENGWFIVPEYINKNYESSIKHFEGLVWREYSLHPPLESLN